MSQPKEIAKTLELPCGRSLSNRLVKSAMSENMADPNHLPGESLFRLYQRWARSRAGALITGNVMIDSQHLGEPNNVVLEKGQPMAPFQKWASVASAEGVQIWMQINHPGRQSPSLINPRPVAPSAIELKVPGFSKPRELTETEIEEIIQKFAFTASAAKEAGFHGVQIHGAHGYLVSQFLSPLSNRRNDKWGGSIENRMRFLLEIYKAMREKVGPEFPISVKVNSADFQRGGFTEEEAFEVLKALSELKCDVIEISGGTYEKAAMTGVTQKQSTREREAYFLEFAERAKAIVSVPLMLTGGFRSLSVMEEALAENKVDVIGMARPFAIDPLAPAHLLSGEKVRIDTPPVRTGVRAIDSRGFLELLWYGEQLRRMGSGKDPDSKLSPWAVLGKSGISMGLDSIRERLRAHG